MKKHITVSQWDELNEKQANIFIEKIGNKDGPHILYPTIGQMIEFLGDDLKHILKSGNKWFIEFNGYSGPSFIELCDALWEAVKRKLTNS